MKWITDVAAALAPIVAAVSLIAAAHNQSVVQPSSPVPTDPTERLEWFKSQEGFQLPEGVVSQNQSTGTPSGAGLGGSQTPAALAGAAFGAALIKPPGAATSAPPVTNPGAAFGASLIKPTPPGLAAGQSVPAAPPGLAAGQSMLNSAAGAPQGLAVPPANVTNTTTVTVGTVTVNTQATDAEGIAKAVDGALTRQLQGTAAAFDDGVEK